MGSKLHRHRRSNLNRSNAGPPQRTPLMSLYRGTPSGAAQEADMKVATLAPMTWMNFHPQATTLVKTATPATASARWPSGPEITMAKPKCLAVARTRGAVLERAMAPAEPLLHSPDGDHRRLALPQPQAG